MNEYMKIAKELSDNNLKTNEKIFNMDDCNVYSNVLAF